MAWRPLVHRSAGVICVAGAALGALQGVGCTRWHPVGSTALSLRFAWRAQHLWCSPTGWVYALSSCGRSTWLRRSAGVICGAGAALGQELEWLLIGRVMARATIRAQGLKSLERRLGSYMAVERIFSQESLLCRTTSHLHLHIFTSAHLHFHMFTPAHLHFHRCLCSSSHLHICTSTCSHLHICTSTSSLHLYIFSSSLLRLHISAHLRIPHICASHIFTSRSSCLSLLRPGAAPPEHNETQPSAGIVRVEGAKGFVAGKQPSAEIARVEGAKCR